MRFFRVYGRVLGLLGRDIRVAGFLALANLIVAGLQFLDPVLFGRVVNLLARSDHMAPNTLWHEAVILLGIWVAVGIGGIVSQHRRGPENRTIGAPPSHNFDEPLFPACVDTAALLPWPHPFRASYQGDAIWNGRVVRQLAGVLPRSAFHDPVGGRATAADPFPELAAWPRADRAHMRLPVFHRDRGEEDRNRATTSREFEFLPGWHGTRRTSECHGRPILHPPIRRGPPVQRHRQPSDPPSIPRPQLVGAGERHDPRLQHARRSLRSWWSAPGCISTAWRVSARSSASWGSPCC